MLEAYGCTLTEALHVTATPQKHSRVLRHLMRFLKPAMDEGDSEELDGLVADCERGLVPLVMPLALLQHHLRRRPVPACIRRQSYLNPYPGG